VGISRDPESDINSGNMADPLSEDVYTHATNDNPHTWHSILVNEVERSRDLESDMNLGNMADLLAEEQDNALDVDNQNTVWIIMKMTSWRRKQYLKKKKV